jgi:hypothetical protein
MKNEQSAVFLGSSGKEKIFSIKILVLCIVAALCNSALSYVDSVLLKIPLYLDTVFIVALCFAKGLLPALLTGLVFCRAITFFIYKYLFHYSADVFWVSCFFSLCILAEIILVFIFHQNIKAKEKVFLEKPSLFSFVNIASRLLVLVVIDCIMISVLGGIIDVVITALSAPRAFNPEDTFKLGLLRSNMPLLPSAILSRIPINIVDRFIVVFGGWGISVLWKKVRRKTKSIKD